MTRMHRCQTTPDEFREIPLDQIVEPWVVLRVVNRESVEYLELRDSIAHQGLLNSICVRPSLRQPGKMEVVDGLYRRAACCELQRPTMPCIVKHNLTDEDVLALQIQANALRPETTAVEYARQIRRIMDAVTARQGTDATLADVSKLIHKNPDWIGQQLDFAQPAGRHPEGRGARRDTAWLCLRARQAADGPASAACRLAKTLPAREFVPVAVRLVKQIQEAARQGKLHDFCKDFEPVPHIRPPEGGACRVPRASAGRSGCREGRLQDAGGWLVLGAPMGAESGRGKHPRTTREIPSADPRELIGTEGRAM